MINKLPESELEIMMIVWHAGRAVTRMEIEQQLGEERNVGATTILSFLSRLEKKGFVRVTKQGKNNLYEPLIQEEDYIQKESGRILQKLFRNSVRNFITALYDGEHLSNQDIEELQRFLEEKREQNER